MRIAEAMARAFGDQDWSLSGSAWADEEEWSAALDWNVNNAVEKPTLAQVEALRIEQEAEANRVKAVSKRQFKLALNDADLLDEVEALIAASTRSVQITWADATTIERDHPMIAAIAAQMQIGDAELDAMFSTAAAIP